MSDTREILRRGLGDYEAPADGYERVLGRRDRRRRNQRLAAGAVAAAIGVAAVLLISRAFTEPEPRVPGGGTDTPSPSPSPPTKPVVIFSGTWPQATNQEAADAQQRADAGDPDVLWQTRLNPTQGGPGDTDVEIVERFLEQELGWTNFYSVDGVRSRGVWNVVFVRCEEGAVNPVYPNDEFGAGCAPTISDTRYETLRFRLEQPVIQGRGGIWIITSAVRLGPNDRTHQWMDREFEQSVPPTTAEVEQVARGFLDARVAGSGAERFLYLDPGHEQEDLATTPELYTTSDGSPYSRAELVSIDQEPGWPSAWLEVTVRLFAEDRVVEQSWVVRPVDFVRPEGGRLLFDHR